MDDWLVSVVKDGKVQELYFSRDLADMVAIRALNPGCSFEKCYVGDSHQRQKQTCSDNPKNKKKKWPRRVMCLETGETWPSIIKCSKDTGIPEWTLYKRVKDGSEVRGCHYVIVT